MCEPTPAATTSRSSWREQRESTPAMAFWRPSGLRRSATISASRRSIPITRAPSFSSRRRIAAPMPLALPVIAQTLIGSPPPPRPPRTRPAAP